MHSFSLPKNRRLPRGLAVASPTTSLFAGSVAHAQTSRGGAYVGLDIGLAGSRPLDSSVSAVTTRRNATAAPNDAPECTDTTPRALSSNGFSPGFGFTGGFTGGLTGGLTGGYSFGGLRIKGEYRARSHGGGVSSIIESTANQAVVSKALEWSPVSPPTESIPDYRVHQIFANLYYDFLNGSRGTPFLGAGVGVAHINLRYTRRLVRKTLAQGYQDVESPLTVTDRLRPPAPSAFWSRTPLSQRSTWLASASGDAGGLGPTAQRQHAPGAEGRTDGEGRKGPLPAERRLPDRQEADRRDREEEAEGRLQRERRADVFGFGELTHAGGELGGVGDDGEPPHERDPYEGQCGTAEQWSDREAAGAADHHAPARHDPSAETVRE